MPRRPADWPTAALEPAAPRRPMWVATSSWPRPADLLGDLPAADQAARLAIQVGERNNDGDAVVAAIHEAFFVSEIQGAYERGRSLVVRGLPIAERLGGSSLTRMLACCAWSDVNTGDLDGAKRNADANLHRAQQEGDTKALIEAHKVSGRIAQALGTHREAVSHDQHILELATESGDLTELAICRLNTGVTWHYLADLSSDDRDYERAQTEYEAALTLTRRLGFRALRSPGTGKSGSTPGEARPDR